MKKRMTKILLSMAICLVPFTPVTAQTRSTEDTEISSFKISPNSYKQLSYRKKEDGSPVYLWYKEATNNRYNYVYVRAYGTSSHNLTLDGNTKSVDHVTCYLGNQYSIRSNIYESGYTSASLGFKSLNYVQTQTIGGWWSPDSAGRYTYAY